MRRIFIQFYLLLLSCFLAVSLLLGVVYKKAIDNVSENYLGDLLSTVLTLIDQELQTLPPDQWQAALEKHNLDTEFNLDIQPSNNYVIDPESVRRLDKGQIILSPQSRVYLKKIENSEYMLVAGPINYSYFLEQLEWLDYVLLLIISLSLAIPVLLWMRPHWQDLKLLENAAKKVSFGQIDTHVQMRKQSSVRSIGRAFNQMTSSIERLVKRQDTLIQDIAHEVRTPIARLRYRLALLEHPDKQDIGIQSDIDEIETLVEELLFRAKVDGLEATKTQFNASEWLSERIMQAKTNASDDITWDRETPSPEWFVVGDRGLLSRAVDNLLNNAKRFAKHRIRVSTRDDAEYYYLSVEDDGIGVPKDQRNDVFEPFVRLDNSRARTTGGHGLGLAIVSSIMKAHQGKASVSPSEWHGAKFILQWPKNPS
jgi:two-component system, OmpR family, sensor histidine kinase RstB